MSLDGTILVMRCQVEIRHMPRITHNNGVIFENPSPGSNGYNVSGLNNEVGFGLVDRIQCSNLLGFLSLVGRFIQQEQGLDYSALQ